jgi:hypothetical protein
MTGSRDEALQFSFVVAPWIASLALAMTPPNFKPQDG